MEQKYFQGSLDKKSYFEGWYFKFVTPDELRIISLIPSISTTNEKLGYLQVIDSKYQTNDTLIFPIDKVKFPDKAFIKLQDNWFDDEEVHLNFNTAKHHYVGILKLKTLYALTKTKYAPTIMGPFSYLKNMECNHGIVSLKSSVDGYIMIDNQKIDMHGATAYIEKDYGTSFPKDYIWLSSHLAKKTDATIFCSYAHIPFLNFAFHGLICVLRVQSTQHIFATWNGAKMRFKRENQKNLIHIQKRDMHLFIEWEQKHKYLLNSPKQGSMDDHIYESCMDEFQVTLKKKENILFQDTFYCGNSEISNL